MPDESATRQNRRTIQRSVAAAKQFERVETICRYNKAKRYGVGAGNYTDFFAGSNPAALIQFAGSSTSQAEKH